MIDDYKHTDFMQVADLSYFVCNFCTTWNYTGR